MCSIDIAINFCNNVHIIFKFKKKGKDSKRRIKPTTSNYTDRNYLNI